MVQSVENSLPENFWTRARFEKAMANDGERILHNDQFLSTTNRKRRSTDDNFWTPERIRKTKDNVPESNPGNQTAPQSRMVLLLSSQLTSQPILHADINIEPWKHYGKLLFTSQSRNGIWEEGTCSAAFVDRQVIITAAHCVINSRGWHRTFQFDHRYNTNNRRGRLVKIHKIYLPKDYNTFTDSNPHGNLR